MKFTTEYIKHTFTEDEKKDIATEMAQKVTELHAAEDEKKAVMSDFKSRIDGLTAQVNGAATKLNNGYEMKSVKCEHVPVWEKQVWQIVRTDNDEMVREKPMTADDLQMQFEDPKDEAA